MHPPNFQCRHPSPSSFSSTDQPASLLPIHPSRPSPWTRPTRRRPRPAPECPAAVQPEAPSQPATIRNPQTAVAPASRWRPEHHQRTPWTLRPRAAALTSSRAASPVTLRRLHTTPQLAGEPRRLGPCHRRETVSRGQIRRCLAPPAPVAASSSLLRLLPPVRHQGAAAMAPEA